MYVSETSTALLKLTIVEVQLFKEEMEVFVDIQIKCAGKSLVNRRTAQSFEKSKYHVWNQYYYLQVSNEAELCSFAVCSIRHDKRYDLGTTMIPLDSLLKYKEMTLLLPLENNAKEIGELCVKLLATNFGLESDTQDIESDIWLTPTKSASMPLLGTNDTIGSPFEHKYYSFLYALPSALGMDFLNSIRESNQRSILGSFNIDKSYRDSLNYLSRGIRATLTIENKRSKSPGHSDKFFDDFVLVDSHSETVEDYMAVQQIELPGDINSENKWTFISYAPRIFKKIRNLFGVTTEMYVNSLSPETIMEGLLSGTWNYVEPLPNSGRSGSVIFKTHNNFLYIKSLPIAESQHLRNILQKYYTHLVSYKDTLLTRFYGLYRIQPPSNSNISPIDFVLMENCVRTNLNITEIYDLKGSKINRSTPIEQRVPGVSLKDMDFDQNRRKIIVGKEMKIALYNQIEKDITLLLNHNILDYSFLVAISFSPEPVQPFDRKGYASTFQRDLGGIKSPVKRNVYFFLGIVDILTQWDFNKMSEFGMKTIVLFQDPNLISATRPPLYHKRFLEYMDTIIM